MFGLTAVRQGEWVAIWNRRGELQIADGPRLVWQWGRTVEPLVRHTAGPHEYLVIKYRDGKVEHRHGPVVVWFDPTQHQAIRLEQAMPLDANEAVVVYRKTSDTVERRVERGPALFVPAAEEWLHEFSWHGADPRNARVKIPHALNFNKLRVIPDQMYYDVADVRTADDALLVVKLMIFFELVDIERMLDQTHDPIADFINAVSADVVDFAAALTFDQFKEQTARLNALDTYAQLVQRAVRIGYRINKVVYRGYHASEALQCMHDHAIEARTQLRLEAETERQAQELADLKLQRERERAAERQAMETEEAEHQNRLKQLAHEARLRRGEAELQARLNEQQELYRLEREHQQQANQEQLNHLQGMHQLQIDLTRLLVAQQRPPDKLIQIDGSRDTRFHVHEN